MIDYIPKVGDVCEIASIASGSWHETEIAYISHQRVVYVINDIEESTTCDCVYFRPIKSARDKAIDDMYEVVNYPRAICAGFYDAGYRKVEPISPDEYLCICEASSEYLADYKCLLDMAHIVSE